MDSQYLATIQMVGFNFTPRSFFACTGGLIDISQNTALYSLIGTYYGGDGRVSFGLPDFRGRAPVGNGQGPGLTNIPIGSKYGLDRHTLSVQEMPSHNHTAVFTPTGGGGGGAVTVAAVGVTGATNQTDNPEGNYWAQSPATGAGQADTYADGTTGTKVRMASDAVVATGGGGGITGGAVTVNNTGGSIPFNIWGPRMSVNFVMCMAGLYPSRS